MKQGANLRQVHSTVSLGAVCSHDLEEERYFAIYSELECDVILFYEKGGVDIGDVDSKASKVCVPLKEPLDEAAVHELLSERVTAADERGKLSEFIKELFQLYRDLHFTYLEINPLVVREKIHVLDVAAKLDRNAQSLCKDKWSSEVQWTKKAGREQIKEEKHISSLDATCAGSMKLTVLNKTGHLWAVLGGGGTSLMLADTMDTMACLEELACYSQFTKLDANELYELLTTVIGLMLEEEKDGNGKALMIGSIANDIVTMIKLKKMSGEGIFRALDEYKDKLRAANISLIIRSNVGVVSEKNEKVPSELAELGIPIFVFGGDVPICELVNFALKKTSDPPLISQEQLISQRSSEVETPEVGSPPSKCKKYCLPEEELIFTKDTKVVAVNMIPPGLQGMVDYDFICGKETPCISAIVRPSSKQKIEEFYGLMESINSWLVCPFFQWIKAVIMMVGEIPAQMIRELILLAKERNVMLIGPTVPKHSLQVNILKPGSFMCNLKGDMAGPMLDAMDLKLYRRGSVVLLANSGGLSKELCVTIARNTDGLYLCLSLGSGRFQGSKVMDHIKYLHDNPAVSMFVLLSEVGGLDEYEVCEALKDGSISKPVIAHCIGKSVSHFQGEPAFFGHTGGGMDIRREAAEMKTEALREAGAVIADTFDDMADKMREVFEKLKAEGKVTPQDQSVPPKIPANMKPKYLPPASR
ncbi:putative ATP-citrate synthase [Apostichopus japonicus]|uniref:ATP citrate synthase n=1 Tax=Stichopus japonicus TaxID=307972 RepID=A0A2G8KZF8_STIJA|nr:putative ATP-citrate synthase [Apostichopus japonicus]